MTELDERCVIYGLLVRGTDSIRYVGITQRRLRQRMWSHRAAARRGQRQPVYNWMRKHGVENIDVTVLDRSDTLDGLELLEVEWIARLRADGADLLNVAEGGAGVRGVPCTPENRKAVGDRFRGTTIPQERIERQVATLRASGYVHSEETRQKIKDSLAARDWTPPTGKDHWNYGRKHTEEHREKHRVAVTGLKYTPERLEAHLLTRPRGEAVNTARFTEADVMRIIERLAAGEGVSLLAKEFDVERHTIGRIKSGKTWSHLDRAAMNGGIAA